MVLRIAKSTKKIFGCCSNWKSSLFRFCNFMMLQKKCFPKLKEHSKLRSSTKMVTVELTSMISKFKNKLRTNEAENGQKTKNSEPQFEIFWFLQKQKAYSLYYAESCNEFAGPISVSFRLRTTQQFSKKCCGDGNWRAVGNAVPNLTNPRFKS